MVNTVGICRFLIDSGNSLIQNFIWIKTGNFFKKNRCKMCNAKRHHVTNVPKNMKMITVAYPAIQRAFTHLPSQMLKHFPKLTHIISVVI